MPLHDDEKFARIQQTLENSDLDALLVKLPENVLYFSNWWPITSWGAALIMKDADPILITPTTEAKFTEKRVIDDMRTYEQGGNGALIAELLKLDIASRPIKIGVEKTFEAVAGTHLGYELAIPNNPFFSQLSKAIPKWELEDAIPMITDLRAVKSKFDFENLRLVNELNTYGLEAAAEALHEEHTEMEIATICEKNINDKIADYGDKVDFIRALAFVMGGPENGAVACWPYNISTGYKMKKGELCMMELNTQVNGYWSDITRTWVVGRNPTEEQRDMMDTINGGVEQALKTCKPGTPTTDIDKASRDYIMATQWGKYHTPFLGHGIGVKLHEPIPMLYPGSEGTVEQGHYFTIEPGIYGKEIKGALRIERNVWLGPDGPVITDLSPCEL